MNTLKKIADFYIFSNIHVGIATFCLVKLTLVPLEISHHLTAWFVFFSTLFSYNLIRFIRLENITGWYKEWLQKNQITLKILMLLSVIGIIFFGTQLNTRAILVLIPFGIATFLYATPLKQLQFRNISVLKLFLIAFSWAGVTVVFPIIQNDLILTEIDYITFMLRFLFVIAITIPFDIRDIHLDAKNLKTIPQLVGVKKAKQISILSFIIFIIGLLFTSTLINFLVPFIVAILGIILILKLNFTKNKYNTAFYIEALPIIWWLLYKLLV